MRTVQERALPGGGVAASRAAAQRGYGLLVARPVAAAVAGAGCIAFSGIFVRLAAAAPSTAAVFRCLYALPVLLALGAREDARLGPRPRRARLLAAVAGVCFAVDLTLWHYTIRYVGAGLGTVLGNLQVVVVGFVAWAVLGERPRATLFAALPVVLVGVVAISGVLGADTFGADPGLGVLFGVGTSLAYAGFLLVLRQGAQDLRRPAGPLADATVVAAVVAAGFGLAVGDLDLFPAWPSHGWLLLLALSSQVVGWLLISLSLPRLPAAITSMVLLLQPVAALVLAGALLREAPSAVQLAGCALVLAGVVIGTARWRARDPVPHEQ